MGDLPAHSHPNAPNNINPSEIICAWLNCIPPKEYKLTPCSRIDSINMRSKPAIII